MEVYPRKLDDWITGYLDYTENTEPPELFKAWCAISGIAAALQRKCYTNLWSGKIYPNMYIVLVADAAGRKGTAMRPIIHMMRETKIKLVASSITKEALCQELDKSKRFIDPGTSLKMHSSLTVMSEELTVFLGQNNVQLISFLNDWYDCTEPWEYKTKGSGSNEIIGVWLNLLGASTPAFLRTALPADAIGGGLLSRIIFIYAMDRKILPLPEYTQEEETMKNLLLDDLEAIHMLKGQFVQTPEFREVFIPWYLKSEEEKKFSDHDCLLYYSGRRPTHLLKLCMIMSASRGNDMQLEVRDFNRALALLEVTEKRMPEVFSGRGKDKNAEMLEKVYRVIRLSGELGVKRSRILSTYKNDLNNWTLDNAIIPTLVGAKVIMSVASGDDTIYRAVNKGE